MCPPFSPSEIKTAILKLDLNNALGPNHISNGLLKNLAESLPKSVSMIFNPIANEYFFLANWEMSVIVPIVKEGDKQNASNYRPISFLSAVSKLLETLFSRKNCLSSAQCYPRISTASNQRDLPTKI